VQALPARLTPVLQRWLRDEDEMPAEFKPQIDPTIPQMLSVLGSIAGLGVAYLGARLMLALAFHSATFTPISATSSLAGSGIWVRAFTPDRRYSSCAYPLSRFAVSGKVGEWKRIGLRQTGRQ
jgi:hypothetical protein